MNCWRPGAPRPAAICSCERPRSMAARTRSRRTFLPKLYLDFSAGAVMDFDPSDDQRLLIESVTRLLADNYAFAQRKTYLAKPEGFSADMWSKFAELGLLGLPFAEQYGGFGGGAQEVMLVMQAFGRVLVLEPFLATVVLGGTAIQTAGSDAQKKALLPAIAEGGLKLAFAHGERQARYDLTDVVTTATRRGGGWVLDGAKCVVSHGE